MKSDNLDFDPRQLSLEGMELFNKGNYEDSKKIFEKLNTHFPNNPDLLNLIAFANLQLEYFNKALIAYTSSIDINPNQMQALFNRAIVNNELGNKSQAIDDYDAALMFDPNNLDIYQNKAAIFEDMGNFDEALNQINVVIKHSPNNEIALANRGNIYQNKFEYKLAEQDYLNAIKINPHNLELIVNLGNVQKQLGKYEASELTFLKAIESAEENYSAHLNLSLLLLFLKKFDRGWNEYEFRETKRNKPETLKDLNEIEHIDGQDKIIIWAEQGIGDQIIYSSMFNDFPKSNFLTVAIDKRLVPIYKRSFDYLNFISMDDLSEKLVRNFDYHLPIGSLGKFYRKNQKSFENQPTSFLKPNNIEANRIKHQLKKDSKKICGVSWKSKNEKIGFAKSLELTEMIELLKIKDINFINLQYGNTEEEINDLEKKHGLKIDPLDALDKFNDLEGLLNYIEACDFVVTSSNLTAHLAGAIGKKTFLMIPHGVGKLWYWHDDDKSCWYPSIKIYRQTQPHDWISVIKTLARDLSLMS
jgi:tetratricopeptide (TPR) repeat protein